MKPEAYISLIENGIKRELDKTIFWVGCGVSVDSGLPLGGALTKKYLEVSLGDSYSSYVYREWERANKLFKRFYDLDTPMIRLEFVIGVIDEVDKEFGKERILQGFEHFHEMTPCKNHSLLNALVAQAGAIIITPNFDSGISLNDGSAPIIPQDDVPFYQVGKGEIYHYHGTVYHIDSLGATIANIKNGFPKEFEKRLRNLLLYGYNIVCVGFSASDYFDATPFFDKLNRDLSEQEKQKLGQACFFEYKTEKKESLMKAERMFSAFPNKRYLFGDTTTFLSHWASGLKIDLKEREAKFEWEEGFDKNSPESQGKKQKFYLIKMSNQLGFRLRNCMTKPLFHMTAHRFLRSAIDNAKEIGLGQHMLDHFDKDTNKSAFADMLKYCRAFGFSIDEMEVFRNGAKFYYQNRTDAKLRDPFTTKQANKSIAEITDYMNSTGKNNWDEGFVIQSISYHVTACLRQDRNSGTYSSSELHALLSHINELRKKHFSEFLYMSYYTTLTKNKWKLEYFLAEIIPSTEELREVISISLEMSSISEAVRAIQAYMSILYKVAIRRKSILLLIKTIKPAYILLRLNCSILTKRINATKNDKNEYIRFWG